MSSLVAVHIVTYNNENTIGACLEALSRQKTELQVCIIDNASTDNTVEEIRRMNFPVVVNPVNAGYAVAHNQAIQLTQSDYVLTLNPDVVLQPGFIQEMVRTLDTDARLGSAAGCLLRIETITAIPDRIDSVGLYMRRNRRQGLLLENKPIEQCPTSSQEIFGPDGAAAFYRRAMLMDIACEGEIFDADFFIHKEDVDICWRALLNGWNSVYIPTAHAYHIRTFRPGQRQRVNLYLRQCAVRNRYLLSLKNEVMPLFWCDLPHILLYEVMIIVYLVIREPQSLKGIYLAWCLRQKMLTKRQIIQARRKRSADELRPFFGNPSE